MRTNYWLTVAGVTALALSIAEPARACGCFTPPDPTVPIVQAGERILFAMQDGNVVAHIQIQYAGNAGEFGWILPLPSVPKLELGTDELFNQLITTTQPKYRMRRVFTGSCSQSGGSRSTGFAGGAAAPQADGNEAGGEMKSPVVIQDSIGPYDYAVLRADDKTEMFKWMEKERYFVPAGTEDVVGPYIRPGAFFLALKLRSGAETGDLQPVVVRYASDLPMIPIVLTSVAAQKDMGIQVWMLGNGRAIPRNYYHNIVNDAAVDWFTGGQNYNDVIIRAVDEAPDHHAFVTEYAGKSDPMKKVLNPDGRFANLSSLEITTDAVAYTRGMQQGGFPWTGQVVSIVQRYIPYPDEIKAMGISAAQWYQNLGAFKTQFASIVSKYSFAFDPKKLTDELRMRIVDPTLAAGGLFDEFTHLTRLYSTLSPEEMTADPVFSFNKDLPEHPNVHEAVLTTDCSFFGGSTYSWLRTEQGFTINYPDGNARFTENKKIPASRRIEMLREAGAPEVLTDNTSLINSALGGSGGCSVTPGARPTGTALLVVVMLALAGAFALGGVRRRRRS